MARYLFADRSTEPNLIKNCFSNIDAKHQLPFLQLTHFVNILNLAYTRLDVLYMNKLQLTVSFFHKCNNNKKKLRDFLTNN